MIIPLCADVDLRVITEQDAGEIYAVVRRNIDWLSPWMDWAHPGFSREDVQTFLTHAKAGRLNRTDFNFGVHQRGSFIGNIGLHVAAPRDGVARIGYWLDRAATGQGIVTKGVRAILDFAFDSLQMHRIEIRCAPANGASRAIPERLGFTLEGTMRETLRMNDGRYQDLIMYSLLEGERARNA